jgi:hypothetical protein
LETEIERLNQRVEQQAWERPGALRLMTHPGVGPITALATDVFLGDPKRFVDGKALASYVGIIPREYSSGGRQRLGGLSKQGNPLLRFLWVKRRYTPCVGIRSCGVSTNANYSRKVWGKHGWPQLANSGSGCGSCCGKRLIITSSVVAGRCDGKPVVPVRGCLSCVMAQNSRRLID